MKGNVKLREIDVEPGTKRSGFLQVADLYGYGLQLPLMIVNGVNDGPILSITAGIHGCEYAGIETTMRLFMRLDPKDIKGALLLVPVANVPGFLGRYTYVNPIDQIDINNLFDVGPKPHSPKLGRVFGIDTATLTYPYGIKGSASELLANALFNEIVSRSNYLIDFHGGDFPEEIVDHVVVNTAGKQEVDKQSESLAKCFNTNYVLRQQAIPTGGGLVGKANRTGIPGVAPTAGHSGKVQESSVQLLYDGTLNLLRYLRMINGSPRMGEPRAINTQHIIRTNHAGIYRPSKNTGDMVHEGEVIGTVRDLFGQVVDEIKAPSAGVLYFQHYNPSVLPGDVVWILGEF